MFHNICPVCKSLAFRISETNIGKCPRDHELGFCGSITKWTYEVDNTKDLVLTGFSVIIWFLPEIFNDATGTLFSLIEV